MPARVGSTRTHGARLLEAGAVAALCATLALEARVWIGALLDLDRTEYGEGPLLAFVLRWTRGDPGLDWLSEVPLSLTVYGPGFPLAWRAVLSMFPAYDPLLIGRALASVSGVLLCSGVAAAAFRSSASVVATLLGLLVLVSSTIVEQFFAHARVDTTASLAVLGAYLVIDGRAHRVAAAAALIAVASLTRQTAALHLIPLAVFLGATHGRRYVFELLGAAAAVAAALWIPTFVAYGGYFWAGAVMANLNPGSIWQGTEIIYRVMATPQFVVILLACWLALSTNGAALRDRWLLGLLASLVIGSVLSFKIGSSTNYFINALWLGAVVVAQVAEGQLRVSRHRALTAAILVACLSAAPMVLDIYRDGLLPPSNDDRRRAIQDGLASSRAAVLADGHLVGHIIRTGRDVLVNDPYVLRLVAEQRPEISSKVLKALGPGSVVILDTPLETRLGQDDVKRGWPREVVDGIARDFCLSYSAADVYVYRPLAEARCERSGPSEIGN